MMLKRRLTVLLIAGLVIAGVVAVYYMPQWQQTQAASKGGRRGGPARDRSRARARHRRACNRRAGLSRRRRHRESAQHRDRALAGRRQDHQHLVHRRAGRPQGIRPRQDRSDDLPGAVRPGAWRRKRRTRRSSPTPGSISIAIRELAATNAVNKQQLDTQRATVSQLEAQVKLDQAAIDNARAILGYTDVVAPIAGRTGIRLVDEGNIVRGADTTGIVILTQLRPISVFFSLPQQNLPDLTRGMAEGPLPVEALTPDGKSALDTGKVVVIDNQVDQTTGTVKVKGEFPNTNLQLWPGQFVNVRVLIDTLRNVVVVPTAAIQRGPNGAFVYVLKDDNTVTVRRVKLTQQDDVRAVVGDGLKAGERVVTTGFARLTEGTQVTVSSAEDAGQVAPRGSPTPGWNAAVRARAKGASAVRARHRRSARHERVFALHPAADRNLAARRRGHAGRHARLSLAAGLLAAAGRLSRPSRSPPSFRARAPT